MIQVRLAAAGVDVEFQAGNGITAILGAAGAGKTLILDSIAGFYRPEGGRIILDDEILFDAVSRVNLPARSRHCGYVAHDWGLFPHMTLRDSLLFPLSRFTRLERHRRVKEMLERFALQDAAALRPREVSPADRARCAMARALIGEPKLLLVDEPGTGLGLALRTAHKIAQIPVLIATRDLDTCFEVAGQMLLLDNGRILQSGAPRKILDQPASAAAARALGIENLLAAEIFALDPSRKTSRLRLADFELTGPYFPGRLRGDRIWLCAQARDLRVTPNGESPPQANQVSARLERATETSRAVRLEFVGGVVAEIPQAEFERQKDNKDWLVEFPPQALRVISRDAAQEF